MQNLKKGCVTALLAAHGNNFLLPSPRKRITRPAHRKIEVTIPHLKTPAGLGAPRLHMLTAAFPSAGARREKEVSGFFNSFVITSGPKQP